MQIAPLSLSPRPLDRHAHSKCQITTDLLILMHRDWSRHILQLTLGRLSYSYLAAAQKNSASCASGWGWADTRTGDSPCTSARKLISLCRFHFASWCRLYPLNNRLNQAEHLCMQCRYLQFTFRMPGMSRVRKCYTELVHVCFFLPNLRLRQQPFAITVRSDAGHRVS